MENLSLFEENHPTQYALSQIRFALNTNRLTLICSMIIMRFVSTMSAGNKLDTYRGKWHRRWLDIWYEKHDLS